VSLVNAVCDEAEYAICSAAVNPMKRRSGRASVNFGVERLDLEGRQHPRPPSRSRVGPLKDDDDRRL